MQLAALLDALRSSHDEALYARVQGDFVRADYIDVTLAQVGLALLPQVEGDGAALRALRQVLRLTTPLPIDALVSPRWPLSSVRLEVALFLPDLDAITTLDDVTEAISAAIRYGAPAYNKGDARGCATCYWATGLCLIAAPMERGVQGMTRVLKLLRPAVEDPIPSIGDDVQAQDDFAWRMRRALDGVLASLR